MAIVEQARRFADLHRSGKPLVLYNAWDAGSARAIAAGGAQAIATGSWSVAAAHGLDDGEALPLEDVLANLRRIVAAVSLPVTLDFESGYAPDPQGVGANLLRVLEAGAIGVNLEDSEAQGRALRSAEAQAQRIGAARAAATRAGVQDFFINARTDVFFGEAPHDDRLVDAALERAQAYAAAGASGLFVPGLADERLIGALCARSPLPVNIMASPKTPPAPRLAALGVARISHGPFPYREAMQALEAAARAAHAAAG